MECLLTGIAVTMFVVALALRVLVPLGLIAGVVAMIFSKRFRNWVDEK
jgi:biopolymer transport protein ExbB/TolQ